jgi:hypothetical protein
MAVAAAWPAGPVAILLVGEGAIIACRQQVAASGR